MTCAACGHGLSDHNRWDVHRSTKCTTQSCRCHGYLEAPEPCALCKHGPEDHPGAGFCRNLSCGNCRGYIPESAMRRVTPDERAKEKADAERVSAGRYARLRRFLAIIDPDAAQIIAERMQNACYGEPGIFSNVMDTLHTLGLGAIQGGELHTFTQPTQERDE